MELPKQAVQNPESILFALLSFFGIFKSKLQRKECTMVEYVGGQKTQKEKEERWLSIFPSIPN